MALMKKEKKLLFITQSLRTRWHLLLPHNIVSTTWPAHPPQLGTSAIKAFSSSPLQLGEDPLQVFMPLSLSLHLTVLGTNVRHTSEGSRGAPTPCPPHLSMPVMRTSALYHLPPPNLPSPPPATHPPLTSSRRPPTQPLPPATNPPRLPLHIVKLRSEGETKKCLPVFSQE